MWCCIGNIILESARSCDILNIDIAEWSGNICRSESETKRHIACIRRNLKFTCQGSLGICRKADWRSWIIRWCARRRIRAIGVSKGKCHVINSTGRAAHLNFHTYSVSMVRKNIHVIWTCSVDITCWIIRACSRVCDCGSIGSHIEAVSSAECSLQCPLVEIKFIIKKNIGI